jgi:hypothetical protein
MVEDNLFTTQQLAPRLDSHSSTLSFMMETLSHHQSLINQLQYEVDFLRRQGEIFEELHATRAHDSAEKIQSEECGRRVNPVVPELNISLEIPPKEEQGPKDKS